MNHIKTEITVPTELAQEMNRIAVEQEQSTDQLIATALQEYIERYEKKRLKPYENKRLFDALNAHYADDDQAEELAISRAFMRSMKITEENEWV